MIEVVRPGIYTTIQDLGRFGYRNQGIPLSGAMDQYSMHLANQMLGNQPGAAVMEFVLQGPELYFQEDCLIVVSGGASMVELNGDQVEMHQIVQVPQKSSLKIKGMRNGMYGYIAIDGGFQTQKVLNSFSFYPKITKQSKLSKGDKIEFNQSTKDNVKEQNASIVRLEKIIGAKNIKVDKGPEFTQLNPETQRILFETEFSPSKDSNRMAYPIQHNLNLSAQEISTAAVQAGTVQLTPSGKLIILMRNAQTTGGYARILQLTPMSINRLAQKRPGEVFKFNL